MHSNAGVPNTGSARLIVVSRIRIRWPDRPGSRSHRNSFLHPRPTQQRSLHNAIAIPILFRFRFIYAASVSGQRDAYHRVIPLCLALASGRYCFLRSPCGRAECGIFPRIPGTIGGSVEFSRIVVCSKTDLSSGPNRSDGKRRTRGSERLPLPRSLEVEDGTLPETFLLGL